MGAVLLLLSATCVGFLAIFVKFAYAGRVNLITTLSVRFILASLFMWLVIIVTRQPVLIPAKDAASLFVVALLGYGGAGYFFTASLQTIPASLAELILFTHPVMVFVFELAVYRFPLNLQKAGALLLSTIGITLVLGNIHGGVDLRGVLLAVVAALSYAAYLLYGKKVVSRHPPVLSTTYVLTYSAAGFTIVGLATGGLDFSFAAVSWMWLGAMAFISSFLGITFLYAGLKRLEAGKASIIGTFEVVVTVVFSALLLGEVMTPLQVTGGLAILLGIIILQVQAGAGHAEAESRPVESK